MSMKTPIKSIGIMIAALALIVLASPVRAQTQKTDSGAGVAVGKGGVGESGTSVILIHKVKSKAQKLIVLSNVGSSLCGNTGAVAMLVVNGVPKVHGAITDKKSSICVKANPGDNVVAVVHTIPLFNGIVCIRLGELSFELQERDVAKLK